MSLLWVRSRRLTWIQVDAAVNHHYDHNHPGMFRHCPKGDCKRARKAMEPSK